MHRLVSFALGCAVAFSAWAAGPLPHLAIAPGEAAVAGVSSGGAMAVQLHVAHSATFARGAGVFAGAPYDCARGSALRATTACMQAQPSPPDVDASIRQTDARAQAGTIDPLAGLARSRVYLFSGTHDTVVRPPVMDALHAYYLHYLPPDHVVYNNTTAAEHAWITPQGPQQCDVLGRFFLNTCGSDVVQEMLTVLYGPLAPKTAGALGGRLIEFDQKEFFEDRRPARHSVADTGWAFVPADCAAGRPCRLMVALHGCLQNQAKVGDAFVRRSGLNEWADTNRIVVLYPQTVARLKGNPQACWDWWGYDGDDYALKTGRQVRAIKAMVDRVSGRN